jgi:hypothetical protein
VKIADLCQAIPIEGFFEARQFQIYAAHLNPVGIFLDGELIGAPNQATAWS